MISEEVKRAYREIMHDYRQYGPEVHLVNYALRDTLARLLKAEHSGSTFCVFTYRKWHPTELRTECIHYKWTDADWQAEADKQLRGEP